MVDFIRETPIGLKDVALRYGVTMKTVYVWARGIGGRKLDTWKLGGRVFTSLEALGRFASHAEPVQYATPSAADRDFQEASRLLQERHG